MISRYWYDKIAASAAEAEQVLADAASEENENNTAEETADEAQEAEDIDEAASREGTVDEARLQEDIMIAQEVAGTDLPTDIKVEIMEEQGVDPSIIDEVIDADTTDAVAAYYGVNPYWLHDKRAAYGNAVFNTIADVQDSAPLAVQLGLLGGALGAAPGIISAAGNRDRLRALGYNPWVEGGKAALAGGAGGALLGGTLGWIGDRFLNKLGSAEDLPLYPEDKVASSTTGSAYLDDKIAAGAGNALKAAGNMVAKAWNKLPGKAKAAIGAATAGAALGGTARLAYKTGEKKQEIQDRWNAGGNLIGKKD